MMLVSAYGVGYLYMVLGIGLWFGVSTYDVRYHHMLRDIGIWYGVSVYGVGINKWSG